MRKPPKLRLSILIFTILIGISLIGCQKAVDTNAEYNKQSSTIKINKHPAPYTMWGIMNETKLTELPKYDQNANRGIGADLRSRDLSQLDLSSNLTELQHAVYDTVTVWPEKLPVGFDPEEVMSLNKTPGLNIKALHNEGITGKGISIGIIDAPLLVDHDEYRKQIKMYEEIHVKEPEAQFHGPAVASIIAGKNLGIAPESEIYFIGCDNFDYEKGQPMNETYVAQAVLRLLEVNKQLPKEKKLKVISISGAWAPSSKGYKQLTAAIKKANKQGVFVVSSNLFETNAQFHFRGLARGISDDPESTNSYGAYDYERWISLTAHIKGFGEFYKKEYAKDKNKKILLVPIDARAIAGITDIDDYTFFPSGGWSFAVPYISGLYTLCCQVKPDITPAEFWQAAYETGFERELDEEAGASIGKIVDPEKLIEKVKSLK